MKKIQTMIQILKMKQMLTMKQILTITPLFFVGSVLAQPKVVEKAIVKVKTETTLPDNLNISSSGPGGGPGGGGFGGGFSMPREIESNTTMTYTPDFMKVETMSDFGNNIVITDRINKKTTTMIEAMGRKTGFYSTDADAEIQKARMDSMRNLRRDSLAALGITFRDNKPEIIYSEETKKVSGVVCKKVTIKSIGQNGTVNENIVWYDPSFKLSPRSTAASAGGMGGGRGMMSMATSMPGLNLIEGFPMEYEITRSNGFKTHMIVVKVQLDPNIDAKTFEIPKGFDLKPASGMGEGGMRMQFRMGN